MFSYLDNLMNLAGVPYPGMATIEWDEDAQSLIVMWLIPRKVSSFSLVLTRSGRVMGIVSGENNKIPAWEYGLEEQEAIVAALNKSHLKKYFYGSERINDD